jgi:hypothetical protein
MTGENAPAADLMLGPGARAMRVIHEGIAAGEIACLLYVWMCAITRRRNRLLRVAVGVLAAEGVGLVVGRGKCPLGPLQRRLGDPVPLFVMWFGPKAARRAVPLFTGITLVGFILLLLRRPSGKG